MLLTLIAVASATEAVELDAAFEVLSDNDRRIQESQAASTPAGPAPRASAPAASSFLTTFADTSGASWGDLLAAGVSVSADEELDAGIDVAPIALAGGTGPLAETRLSIGATPDATRIGVAIPLVVEPRFTLDQLGVAKPTPAKAYALAKTRSSFREPWKRACAAFLRSSPESLKVAPDNRSWNEVQQGCSGGESPIRTFALHVGSMTELINAEEKLRKDDPTSLTLLADIVAASAEIRALVAATDGAATLAGVDDKTVEAAYQQALWKATRLRVTPMARVDFAPVVWGYNPDPSEPLAKGSKVGWAAGINVGLARQRTTIDVGASYLTTGSGDDAVAAVTPSFSLLFTAAALDGKGLLADGSLRLLKKQDLAAAGPELPPRLNLGLKAKVEVPLTEDATRTDSLTAVEVTAFADFHVNSTLAFRLGVPLRGETVTTEAEDESGLQFSLPVFVMTSLSM